MSDTTLRLKKSTELLRQDHDRVRELLARCESLDRSDVAQKRKLLLDIDEEVSNHSQIEERLFFPAVENVDQARVREALADHRALRALLDELMQMGAGEEGFDAKVKQLRESVERHLRRSETELFPLATKLPGKALADLGAGIAKFREPPTAEDLATTPPLYPTLDMPGDGQSPLPPGASSKEEEQPRGYANWGSE